MTRKMRLLLPAALLFVVLLAMGCAKGDPPWIAEPEGVALNQIIVIDGYEAELAWDQADEFHFDRYRILYSKNFDTVETSTTYKDIYDIGRLSMTLILPEPDVQYYFAIAVYNDYGNYALSNIVAGRLANP